MQLGVRELARAEARKESGGKPGPTALEILANMDAMELAVEDAATVERFRQADKGSAPPADGKRAELTCRGTDSHATKLDGRKRS